ncbi:MAG: Gfo/Idh/MocA family oxidoreductase [Alicyclobacillus sp.]|nr:Gfo/Idh/MocA family oxidoreductase [Alicyclobacillus sp.]
MTLRVGIIGTGFGARVHAPLLQSHKDFELVAISSVYRGHAHTAAADAGIPRSYDQWQEMLHTESLDVVVVASNPRHHLEMTLAALSKGLHVLCEKPPALNLAEARTMAEAARRSNRIAAMNFEWRYLAERQAIRRLLQERRIGEVLHVHWIEAWPFWPEVQHRPPSWLWESTSGGGQLGALGSHMIDSLVYWLGPIQSIQGDVSVHITARQSEQGDWVACDADDSFCFHGHLVSGPTCTVQLHISSVPVPPRIEFFGTEGHLLWDGTELRLAQRSGSIPGQFQPVALDRWPAEQLSAFREDLRRFVQPQHCLYTDLARAIAGDTVPSLPTLDQAVHVQAVIDAIRVSARNDWQMVHQDPFSL